MTNTSMKIHNVKIPFFYYIPERIQAKSFEISTKYQDYSKISIEETE